MANVEMTILGCDFLAFHNLQLDFTDMLPVGPHVIGWHHEHVSSIGWLIWHGCRRSGGGAVGGPGL